ncbi:peptidoglycan DD-metalloendopeptidase family protein [Virgibacillus sp. FSP13]
MVTDSWKCKRKRTSLLTKIVMTTCLSFGLLSPTVFAEEKGELVSVFHVYVDGEHIGKVDDQTIVNNIVEEKITNGQEQFDNYDIAIGEDVSVVPEKVFNPTYNNDKVSDILKHELSVHAKAVELDIADETAGYFKDRDTAEAALKAYQAKYIDEEDLEKLTEEHTSAKTSDQPEDKELSVGDSIITDVALSEKVSFSKQKVQPKEVLTVKDGVKLLEKGTLTENTYQVKEGDVLGNIANKYDLTTKELLELNPSLNEDSLLQIDQEVNVTEYKPFVDVIVKEEKKDEKTINHETEIVESDELYKGDEKVKQKGKDGKKVVHYAIEMKNGKVTSKKVIDENVLEEPTKEIIIKGTKVIPSRGSGDLSWPAIGGYVSSHVGMRWGSMHKGMDIARPSNRSILAADNGVVASAGWNSGGYGNKIVINHNNGMQTVYAHLASISVHAGQTVEKGSKIGVMGSTGDSTGTHLHFEVYQNGALQHPADYF